MRPFPVTVRSLARTLPLPLLLVLTFLAPASARDDDGAVTHETRVFRVGALTGGRSGYIGERSPPVGPNDVVEESLFGMPATEPVAPFGDVDDLIALLRRMAAPSAWTQPAEGASLAAQGSHAIVATHRPRVLDEVARVLADLERRALTMVTVEIRAVQASGGAPPEAESAPRGPSLTLTGFMGQRIAGFDGRQSAYVLDYDVEVAENATASDPLIGVSNLGLRADVFVAPPAPGNPRVHIDVSAWLADLADAREVLTGEHRIVEARQFDVATVSGGVDVQPGSWASVSGRGREDGWTFFVRVTLHAWEAKPAEPPALRIPAPSQEPETQRLIDVRDLARRVPSYSTPAMDLARSYHNPLVFDAPEPVACLATRDLISVLEQASPQGRWEKTTLQEISPGTLFVRSTPNVLRSTFGAIAALRRQLLVSIGTRADLVEVPSDFLARLRGPTAGSVLEQALKAGTARRLERLDLVSRPAVRHAITAGRHVTYIADYAVEIAKGASISNPVTQILFAGVHLDVTAHPTGDGRGIALEVQFVRTEHEGPIRHMRTPHGAVEVPELQVFRLRSGLIVPVGETVLVGAQGNGPTRRALLLTSSITRAP